MKHERKGLQIGEKVIIINVNAFKDAAFAANNQGLLQLSQAGALTNKGRSRGAKITDRVIICIKPAYLT